MTALCAVLINKDEAYAAFNSFKRFTKRDTLRAAVFFGTTPLETPLINSDSTAKTAAFASTGLPAASVSSALRTKVLMRLTRERFTAVRRSV